MQKPGRSRTVEKIAGIRSRWAPYNRFAAVGF